VQENAESFDSEDSETAAYAAECASLWSSIFNQAKEKHLLHFALALNPEFRGMQSAGWSTAREAFIALDQYVDHVNTLPTSPIKIRILLALYSHLWESSGFYEVPKNMLRIISEEGYSWLPFNHISKPHTSSGEIIAPNANRIMKDLIRHANSLGFNNISSLISSAFDAGLRNGFAHADYIVSSDGVRLRRRNGGNPYVVPYDIFVQKINKSIVFFESLRDEISTSREAFVEPSRLRAAMSPHEPKMPWIISYDPATRSLSISSDHDQPPGFPSY
jgi:hypothetical protein